MSHFLRRILPCVPAFLLLASGCFQNPKPEGLPDLVPFQLKIEQEGKPLQDASVQLVADECQWAVTGNTDTQGIAVIASHGQYLGAPQGKFKVVLRKSETDEKISPDRKTKTIKIYSLVEPRFSDPSTTSLEVTVDKKTTSVNLDAGKIVRELTDTVSVPYQDEP